MFSSTMWGGDQRGRRRLPHAVVIDRRQNSRKASLVSFLSFGLVGVVVMYLVVIWSFHSSSRGGKEQSTEQQQYPERIQKNVKRQSYCDFRAYPDHRYYGIPEFHGTDRGNHLPEFLNTEYIYGQLPQMIQPKESAVKQKLCVDQSEWYKPEPILGNGNGGGNGKTRLPFADGTNPSILRLKDNPRINESIRRIFTKEGNNEDNVPVYLTTICMTNSQCGWKDTEQQIIDYRLSTQEKPSTVRTVLLVLNRNFETLVETTIYTEIDAKFGNRIKGPQHVGGSGRSKGTYKKKSFALDDARLFTYRGDVWLSYREGKGFGYDKQVLNKVHFDLQNNDGTSTFEVTLKASETETLCCGRNMALLDNVQTNHLQALTWVDPITVVDVELKRTDLSGRRLSEANGGKKKQNKKKKSHFHGTNGFMLYLPKTQEYLGIGHFHRPPDRETNEYARFGHHYTHAFFTIPATPPFHLKRLSPEVVLPSHAKSDDAEVIQFWSGLELHDDDTIVMAYGINDCEGAATYLELSTVESLLRNVPEGKEVVDLMMPLTP
mmetsp:Transcript_43344/g.105046  ORF Transcript_43344/g.105046 Transcript_43344/m.105046 type:complete len:547 (-) Transcript_43344:24-1664(-)